MPAPATLDPESLFRDDGTPVYVHFDHGSRKGYPSIVIRVGQTRPIPYSVSLRCKRREVLDVWAQACIAWLRGLNISPDSTQGEYLGARFFDAWPAFKTRYGIATRQVEVIVTREST